MTDPKMRKKSVKRIGIWAGIVLAAVCVLLSLVPTLLSSRIGTSFLLAQLNRSLDGTLTLDDLSLGWFSGVRVQNLRWKDAAGQTQVQIVSLKARPKWLALLGGRIALTDAVVDGPFIEVKMPASVLSAAPQKSEQPPQGSPPSVYRIGPVELEIRQGQAVLEQARPNGLPPVQLHVRNLASTVILNQSGKDSSVSISMDVGDGSQQGFVQAKGQGIEVPSPAGLAGLSGQFDVEIRSLSLASLAPLLALAGKDVQMAGTLNGTANAKIANGQIQTLQASADLTGFQQVFEGQTLRLEQPVKLRTRLSARADEWLIEQMELESSFCRLSGKGGLNALEYTLSADLAQTQAVTAPLVDWKGYKVAGLLTADGKVLRNQQAIEASGKLAIRDCVLRQDSKSVVLSELSQNYDLTLSPDFQSVQIRRFELAAKPIGTVSLSDAKANWSRPDVEAVLALTGTVDLKNAVPLVNFFYPLPADLSLAGVLRPNVRVEMKEGLLRVLTASTELDNLTVSKANMEPFVSRKNTLKADIAWDLKKNELRHLKDFELNSDAVRVRGNLQQTAAPDKSQIAGQAQAEYDWKEVSSLVRPFLLDGLTLEGKRNDQFSFSVSKTSSGIDWQTLAANGSFGFQRASYKGLSIGTVDLKLKADKGTAAIDLADTPVNNGVLRLAGDIDFKNQPPVFRLRKPMAVLEKVQINDELTRNLLEYVNPLFANASRVSGVADFSCEELVLPLQAERKDLLKLKAVLALSQVTMRSDGFLKELLNVIGGDPSVVLTLHPTPLSLDKEVLSYQNMQVDVGKNPIVFSGQVGLDRRLRMEMKMPWTLSGQTVRSGESPSDQIVLPVRGTIDRPQVDWNRLLQLNLGRILLRELLK
ncbi:MAG: hypothetical protein WHS88_08495 [Anaerohalosphaeraceae bacterium]